MTSLTVNFETAPAHQVMAAAGKKILRPGGRTATQQLFDWAGFQPGETVLELATSFGYSAIALAKRYSVRVVGVEKNPESVARAQANICAAGLESQMQVIEGDIFHLEQIAEQFDYVLAEAILTMQPALAKAKVLKGICDRIKPGGKFLSHELLAHRHETEIHTALAAALRVNSTPLSQADWRTALEAAGLSVVKHQTGPMDLLNPVRIIEDEGVIGAAQFFWNGLTRPTLRRRLLSIRRVFRQYDPDLGYLLQVAQRQ